MYRHSPHPYLYFIHCIPCGNVKYLRLTPSEGNLYVPTINHLPHHPSIPASTDLNIKVHCILAQPQRLEAIHTPSCFLRHVRPLVQVWADAWREGGGEEAGQGGRGHNERVVWGVVRRLRPKFGLPVVFRNSQTTEREDERKEGNLLILLGISSKTMRVLLESYDPWHAEQ